MPSPTVLREKEGRQKNVHDMCTNISQAAKIRWYRAAKVLNTIPVPCVVVALELQAHLEAQVSAFQIVYLDADSLVL